MDELPQWTVEMRIERHISVTVEAATEAEARARAESWDIVGDEQPGDTINYKIISVSRDQ